MQTQRTCTKCGTAKPDDGYYFRRDGRALPECKECTKARTLARKRAVAAQRQAERDAEEARLRAISHKVCSKCREEKDRGDFYRDKNRNDGLSCWCKACQQASMRAHRARNGPRGVSPLWASKIAAAKAMLAEAKDRPCVDCGVAYPLPVMHMHHRDPDTKVMNLAQMVRRWAGRPDAIRAEIAKCDVLCANCHALRHMKEDR